MSRCKFRAEGAICFLFCFALFFGLGARRARAQAISRGTVTITVLDPTGRVVPAATLDLLDLDTNSVRKAATTGVGTYSFVGLPIGNYQLTVSKTGFSSQVNRSVTVQAGQVTDITIKLRVGTGTQKVVVSATAAPLLQATSTTVASTVSMKQLQDLPLSGRDVSSMAFLVPGYVQGNNGGHSTWNGLPVISQTNSMDGVVSSSSRMKFGGSATPGPSARLDSISQMTVTTGQMGVGQGYGQGAMTTNFITQRGTNSYHGRVYEDFRNSYLNANTWGNNARNSIAGHTVLPTPKLILNDFGGDIGGPIIKNKLFFFGAMGIAKQPGGFNASATVLTPTAQKGFFTTQNGATTVCLLTYDASKCPQQTESVAQQYNLPTSVNNSISTELGKINGVLKDGAISPVTGDPNVEDLTWFVSSPVTTYFPTLRGDYNISPNLRMDLAWNETKNSHPGASAPYFPGSTFTNQIASRKANDYTASLGLDWTISPTLVNQFRGGYYYNATWYAFDATTQYTDPNFPIVGWAYGTSGQNYHLPVTTFYPIVNFNDNMTWQKGSHMVTWGVSYWREQDHYWHGGGGVLHYNLGLSSNDPAYGDFNGYFTGFSNTDRSRARNLYATLVGEVTKVGPGSGGFPLNYKTYKYVTPNVGTRRLDELMSAWGLYINDSWRMMPTLTVDYGLRWDFNRANHDLTASYHSATLSDAFGPTAPGDIFQPGVLNGVATPMISQRANAYQNYYVAPQPRIGLAWNPRHTSGLLAKLTGDGNTVIRAGFDIRKFTEPEQYYWDGATNYGFAYIQQCNLSNVAPSSYSSVAGTFPAGSISLGQYTPDQLNAAYPFLCNPPSFQPSYTQASQTWTGFDGGTVNGFNYNIRQPYLEEWTFGIQRQIGQNNVLEVRYLGHHALHEWVDQNVGEVNVFNNGFLTQFQAAQNNLAVNASNGQPGNFADLGFAGDQALPIFEAAFASEESSPYTAKDYKSGTFINWLNEGAVGSAASQLSAYGGPLYFCNLVGSSNFSPCIDNVGYSVPGASYPINYFSANPYAAYSGPGVMVDSGYGNYNALQVDFRQNNWHGMQFDANYTWSHSLGIEPNGNWTGTSMFYTLRNMRLSYGPAAFDIHQVLHVSGTYDLPFGTGHRFLNTANPVVNRIVGGWTVGTIVTYQTGMPVSLLGGYNTFNDFADGGLVYNGVTNSQLQSAVGVYHIPGATNAHGINPSLFQPQGGISGVNGPVGGTITPNTVPGTMALHPWLYGPHFSNTDIAITKQTPIREKLLFTFQAEFLNAFNHPTWGTPSRSIQSTSFGNIGVANGPRSIQLRASIDF